MTAPGAPEAPMTPEQRIKEADRLARQNLKIGLGAEYLGYDRLFHAALALQFAKAIRESESSALRRAAKYHDEQIARLDEIDSHKLGLTEYGRDHRDWHRFSAKAIRALIPSSPSAESDNGT